MSSSLEPPPCHSLQPSSLLVVATVAAALLPLFVVLDMVVVACNAVVVIDELAVNKRISGV